MGRLLGISVLAVAACGGAKPRPVSNSGGGELGCLPAAGAATYRLVNVDGRTHVCRERQTGEGVFDTAKREACWLVDLATGAVRASDVVVEPGRARAVPATWTADGLCAEGYCLPGAAGDDPNVSADLAVGAGVAVMLGPAPWAIFDGAKRRIAPPPGGAEDGPSAAVGQALVVDDVVFLGDYDAGPHADVHVYAADGRYLGQVTDPADTEEYSGDFELWNGSVNVLGAHEVAFAEHLLQRVLVFDTRAKKVTQVWRREVRPADLCTQEQVDIYFDPVDVNLEFGLEEGTVTPACKQALDDVEGRFGPYGLARNTEGALVALARRGDGMALVTFDDAGRVTKDLALDVCDPKRRPAP